MKIEISKKTDNPLLSRIEVVFEIKHAKSEATPSRKQVKDALGAKLGKKEFLVVRSIVSPMGAKASHGLAYLYKDKKAFERLAKDYLKKRDSKEPKPKKAPVGQVPVEEEKKEEEKPAEEPKEEAPKEEEKKEESKEEK